MIRLKKIIINKEKSLWNFKLKLTLNFKALVLRVLVPHLKSLSGKKIL